MSHKTLLSNLGQAAHTRELRAAVAILEICRRFFGRSPRQELKTRKEMMIQWHKENESFVKSAIKLLPTPKSPKKIGCVFVVKVRNFAQTKPLKL